MHISAHMLRGKEFSKELTEARQMAIQGHCAASTTKYPRDGL
jgi:hypothetical protein